MNEVKIKFRRIDKLDRDFTQISNNVFYLLRGKPTAYMVYSYLNHRYNINMNYAFPSIKTIQQDLGIGSNKTVVKALETLEEKKLIRIIKEKTSVNRNAVNKYVVYYPVIINALSEEEEHLAPEEFVEMVAF
ncbi:helix-turn-helix domain-containing protein [Bacillus sp. NTK071]|uniref:helix-turn-helix domain-containing protein n=1 Tax=Bacillus sp. NTK071 TaxID=2802175 RepID=UPI001A8D23B3|nr:helix-turn-helix domain-containing protein [Bacillus sp. NTK071]MBN8211100.1 helix-turn-helix domain-containing protein [Bacillus sp. NTK071]